MLKFVNDVKLKAGVAFREWKEKQEAKKALQSAVNSEHGHGRFFLLTVPATATICAAIVEVYWAFLFCIEATGHLLVDWSTSVGSDTPAAGAWHFAFTVNSVAVLIGLVCATVPIVMISMVWLPVQFTMRGTGRWRRGTMIFCGLLANLLVIVSGTVVMNGNRQEQVRESLVVEQTADANRAMLAANVEGLQHELDTLMNHRSTYVATAASVGADAYERDYVRQARSTADPRLPLIERALGSARRADELRAEIRAARQQVAAAAPVAASQANVQDEVGATLNQFSQAVSVWRPPFVALICTLVGIFGSWWVLALMQGLNPRDVMRSGWADEAHRIEDKTNEPSIVPQPMKPAREVVTDAETGEELIKITPKPHWRKQKGKKQRVETTPEPLPDETGFQDTARSGVTLGGVMELAADSAENQGGASNAEEEGGDKQASGETGEQVVEPSDEATHADDNSNSNPQPEPSDDEAALALQELELTEQVNEAVAVDAPPATSSTEESLPAEYEETPDEAGSTFSDAHQETSDREEPEIIGREPETRDERLLPPASVAAE